jgi:IS5 family transposase
MDKQIGFSELEYSHKRKKTRREVFLEKMEEIVPLGLFCECVKPFYYVRGNGRPPIELEIMLRMYLISNWYNLSDEATEDLIYENQAVRRYVGIDLGRENAPDATTLCKFRGLLERNDLNKKIFDELNRSFSEKNILFTEGAIVDATIIEAPDSRKNKERSHDPEMSTTKKNSRYYFGFKAHIATDTESGLVRAVEITTARVADIEAASSVLSGKEKEVSGDAGYIGIDHRPDVCAKFKDEENPETINYYSHKKGRLVLDKMKSDVKFNINRKRAEVRKITDEEELKKVKKEEYEKSRVRAKVEHAFRIIKHVFGFRKTRYRGLNKNRNKLYMLFGLANLYFIAQKTERMTAS